MKTIVICKKIQQPSDYLASVPQPFPVDGMFDVDQATLNKATLAERLVGKLDGITQTLPDIGFFLKMFSFKDATSSSQIEGTQATMADALEKSAGIDTNADDSEDILFYIKALEYGLDRLKEFPLSLRFLKELHEELMKGARTTHFSDPGNFRSSQNWIGGLNIKDAKFVPAPPSEMMRALGDFENFLYDDTSTLPLVHIAYAHAQFETIHPFLDGNGRLGRLLVTFLLYKKGLIENPVLFLSSFFKRHQKLYYQKLDGYHNGEALEWVDFFLSGVIKTAQESIAISKKIRVIRDKDMEKIQKLAKRESESSMKVIHYLFAHPIITTKSIMQTTGFSRPGAQKLIDRFIDLDILERQSEKEDYDRKYVYRRYFSAFVDE
jgi:Fic family protein